MKKISDRSRLAIANSISVVGTSMTWAGFPIYVSNLTGNYEDAGILFATSTAVGFIFALAGGGVADAFSKKWLFIGSSFANFFLMTLFWKLDVADYTSFLLFSIFTSIISSFQTACVTAWYVEVCKRDGHDVEKSFAGRNASNLIAKSFGMSTGPILYEIIGSEALLLDGGTSLLQGLILLGINYNYLKKYRSKFFGLNWDIFVVFRNPKLRRILAAGSAAESIRMSLAAGGVLYLKSLGHSGHVIAITWLTGLLGSFTASLILSRGILNSMSKNQKQFLTFCLTACGLVIISLSSGKITFFLIGLFVTCAANVLFSIPLLSRLTVVSKNEEGGRAIGARQAIDCLTGFFVVLLATKTVTFGSLAFAPLILMLIIRTYFGHERQKNANT